MLAPASMFDQQLDRLLEDTRVDWIEAFSLTQEEYDSIGIDQLLQELHQPISDNLNSKLLSPVVHVPWVLGKRTTNSPWFQREAKSALLFRQARSSASHVRALSFMNLPIPDPYDCRLPKDGRLDNAQTEWLNKRLSLQLTGDGNSDMESNLFQASNAHCKTLQSAPQCACLHDFVLVVCPHTPICFCLCKSCRTTTTVNGKQRSNGGFPSCIAHFHIIHIPNNAVRCVLL